MDKAGFGEGVVLKKNFVTVMYRLNLVNVGDDMYKLGVYQKGDDDIIDLRPLELIYGQGVLSSKGELVPYEERGSVLYYRVTDEVIIPESLIWTAIENITKE